MSSSMTAMRRLISRYPWVFTWILPLVFFLLCSFYYQGTIARCGDYLMSGPGDQTAGLIWLHSAVPAKPLWGFTAATNYPFGEWLSQPINWSGALEYILYWLLSSLVGGICGYNLLNILGFFTAATAMYAFVKWLTRNPWIALLAGYAVAFAPYYQAKTSGHPSYVYQGVFIILMWLFVMMWRRPRWPLAAGLGVLLAATFYMDPYFVLLAAILMVGLIVASVIYDLARKDMASWRQKVAMLALMGVITAVLLLPLVYIRFHYAAQINQMVSGTRGDIRSNAMVYSARLWEYVAPAESHPVLKSIFGPGYVDGRDHHGSNPAEYVVNLSLTLLGLIIVVKIMLIQRWRHRKPLWSKDLPLRLDPLYMGLAALAVGLLAVAFSLPPRYHGLPMPTYFLTAVITMWRVFARLFVLVNISLVVLASLALAVVWPSIKSSRRRLALILLLFVGVAFEYQIYNIPRPVWSFSENTPSIYYRLAQRADIQHIAEYSMDEQPQTPMPMYYMTWQWVHHKTLLNSALSNSPQAGMRGALRDLQDPQTLPSLRALGVQAILVHGVKGNVNIPGLELIDYEADVPPTASKIFHDSPQLYPIGLYRVLPGDQVSTVETLQSGFVYPKMDSPISYDYVGGSGAVMSVQALPGKTATGTSQMCFLVKSTSGRSEVATARINNQLVWIGLLNDQWKPAEITTQVGQPVTFWVDQPGPGTFMLDDLGCQAGASTPPPAAPISAEPQQ